MLLLLPGCCRDHHGHLPVNAARFLLTRILIWMQQYVKAVRLPALTVLALEPALLSSHLFGDLPAKEAQAGRKKL